MIEKTIKMVWQKLGVTLVRDQLAVHLADPGSSYYKDNNMIHCFENLYRNA